VTAEIVHRVGYLGPLGVDRTACGLEIVIRISNDHQPPIKAFIFWFLEHQLCVFKRTALACSSCRMSKRRIPCTLLNGTCPDESLIVRRIRAAGGAIQPALQPVHWLGQIRGAHRLHHRIPPDTGLFSE